MCRLQETTAHLPQMLGFFSTCLARRLITSEAIVKVLCTCLAGMVRRAHFGHCKSGQCLRSTSQDSRRDAAARTTSIGHELWKLSAPLFLRLPTRSLQLRRKKTRIFYRLLHGLLLFFADLFLQSELLPSGSSPIASS